MRPPPTSTPCCPATAPLADRLAAWDARFVIPVDRLPPVVDRLVARFRARGRGAVRAARRRGPAGLARHGPAVVRLQLVRRRAPVARRHQHGPAGPAPRTSPRRRPRDVPGHHLEHAWKEADLVDARRPAGGSILLINTPECLISEGLADLGARFAAPARRARRPAGRDVSSGPGSDSAGSGRGSRGRRAVGRLVAPRRDPDRDRAAMPRSCGTPTAGRTTRSSTTS